MILWTRSSAATRTNLMIMDLNGYAPLLLPHPLHTSYQITAVIIYLCFIVNYSLLFDFFENFFNDGDSFYRPFFSLLKSTFLTYFLSLSLSLALALSLPLNLNRNIFLCLNLCFTVNIISLPYPPFLFSFLTFC